MVGNIGLVRLVRSIRLVRLVGDVRGIVLVGLVWNLWLVRILGIGIQRPGWEQRHLRLVWMVRNVVLVW